jgi:hypothetical protein
MALTEEQLKTDLEGYLRKLAGVMPVGHYWFGIDPKSKPAGVQLYSGQLLFRSAYQKHWEFVSGGHRTVLSEKEWQAMVDEQGFCPYFSYGNGSTTYRMPLVQGVHPKFVSALAEAGQYVEAGLPNITGSLNTYARFGQGTGAIYTDGSGFNHQQTGSYGYSYANLDASRSSPVYGNSDTVQPPALTFLIGEYVVGSVATLGEADAESLLAGQTLLDSKVGALESGSGFNAAGKAEIVRWGIPDYSSLVTVAALPFTAPTDCFAFICAERNANANTRGAITVNGTSVLPFNNVQGYMVGDITTQLWLKAGDVVGVSGNARFVSGYYCGGSY